MSYLSNAKMVALSKGEELLELGDPQLEGRMQLGREAMHSSAQRSDRVAVSRDLVIEQDEQEEIMIRSEHGCILLQQCDRGG